VSITAARLGRPTAWDPAKQGLLAAPARLTEIQRPTRLRRPTFYIEPIEMTDLFNVLLIETKNVCTRGCWFCKFGQERQDESVVEMPWSRIERIARNLGELDYEGTVSWFWINEPLMDKRMPDIVRLTKECSPQAFQSLVTNGDLLTPVFYENLKKEGLDAVGVSVYDNATYEKVRRMKDAHLVLMDMRNARTGVLENRAGNIKQEPEEFEHLTTLYSQRSCERPFNMLTLNALGQAVLCCADMYSDVVMGDALTERLEQICPVGTIVGPSPGSHDDPDPAGRRLLRPAVFRETSTTPLLPAST